MRTMTRADIAQATGYSAKYVRDNLTKRPDFPKPVIRLSTQNVRWLEDDIRKWMRDVTQAA